MTLPNITTQAYAQDLKISGSQIQGLITDKPTYSTLGGLLTAGLDLFFTLAAIIAFLWMIWGVFQYIFSGGDKEGIAKGRSRIIYAIVGLLVIAISFALSQYVQQVLNPRITSSIPLVATAYAEGPVDLGATYGFGNYGSFGQGISRLVPVAFTVASVVVVLYFLIGAFYYVMSAGNKESVAKGQKMMTNSAISFLLLILVFIIIDFVPQFFGLKFSIFK